MNGNGTTLTSAALVDQFGRKLDQQDGSSSTNGHASSNGHDRGDTSEALDRTNNEQVPIASDKTGA
jgi:hypothetical protein